MAIWITARRQARRQGKPSVICILLEKARIEPDRLFLVTIPSYNNIAMARIIWTRLTRPSTRLDLEWRFTLVSFVVFVVGATSLAWWVGYQIELRIVHEFSESSALHAYNLIEPHLAELDQSQVISSDAASQIDADTEIVRRGHPVFGLTLWDASGRVLYSNPVLQPGQTSPRADDLARAWQGEVVSSVKQVQDLQIEGELRTHAQFMTTYVPVRATESAPIVAIAEVREDAAHHLAEISSAQLESCLSLSAVMLVIYFVLIRFLRRVSKTITRQSLQLQVRLTELEMVLHSNEALNAQVRRAAASAVAVNEQFLRRVGSELHDGVAQDLSLALLRVDHAVALCEACTAAGFARASTLREMSEIQGALREGLQEARSLASGLVLPHLSDLTLAETLAEVVAAHERRTDTRVELNMRDLPERIAVPAQVTVYRFVQEALNNAFRHAQGIGQRVQARVDEDALIVEVSDQGKGFDPAQPTDGDNQLGLIGMRERVESLGGAFCVETSPGQGTRVIASVPMTIEAIAEK